MPSHPLSCRATPPRQGCAMAGPPRMRKPACVGLTIEGSAGGAQLISSGMAALRRAT